VNRSKEWQSIFVCCGEDFYVIEIDAAVNHYSVDAGDSKYLMCSTTYAIYIKLKIQAKTDYALITGGEAIAVRLRRICV
jgi:hypothetical protein